jgi:tetratricopeptide (TPR) repeat protein
MIRIFLSVFFIVFGAISLRADDVTAILAEADSQYSHRDEAGYAQKAIEGYSSALQADPKSYEAAWKLSKAYWYLGNHSEKNEKEAIFQKGIDAAKRAIAIDPNSCEGHFWLGVNYGLYGEAHGKLKALGLINPIKDEMKKAMDIQENCECGGPQRVLGRLYSKAPWFKGGSKSKAIESLNESLKLCPNDTQSRMFLVDIYLDDGKKELAIQQLKGILTVETDPGWIPENKENKMLAEKMLAQLQQKK